MEYALKYQGDERIKIKELWLPAVMLFEEAYRENQSEEFIILRQKARYTLLKEKRPPCFSKPRAHMDWLEQKIMVSNSRDYLFIDAGNLVPSPVE